MARNINNDNPNNAKEPGSGKEAVNDKVEQESFARSADISQRGASPEEPSKSTGEAEILQLKPEKKKNGKRIALIVVIVAVIAAAAVCAYLLLGSNKVLTTEEEAQIIDNGTFYTGVSVLGIDLSGKTMDEAKPLVEQAVQEKLDGISIAYDVKGETVKLGSAELGASVDTDTAMEAAMLYGREGGFLERQNAIKAAEESGMDVSAEVIYSQEAIAEAVEANSKQLSSAPKDATIEMKKISDEDKMITGTDIQFTDGRVGYGADEEKLTTDIYNAVTVGDFDTVTAEIIEIQPKVMKADLEQLYTQRGVYETKYPTSAEGRRYNIWKMADVINGVKIEPGETWSINEEAGPRTFSKGWKGAPGISDGEYKEEAGGGICQVSSTLYNAVIRAEVDIVHRMHHSWPLDYVPGGLDATISTGAPDFIIKNNYEVPIYIVANCDGEGAKTIEVSIYGPPYEDGLTRDFYSELVKTFGGGDPIQVPDPTLPAGQTASIIGAHQGKTFNVYKQLLDQDGKVVGEPKLYSVDTYAYKPAKVRVGTAAPVWVDPGTPAPPAPAPETPAPETPAPVPETPPPAPEPPPAEVPAV